MFTKYKKFIKQYILLNFIEWKLFKSKLTIAHYKKGDIIHNVGDICTQLIFLNSGLARAYIIDEDGKDHTWSIFFNDKNAQMTNLYVVDYDSFINQKESKIAIDVIEDCELIITQYKDVQFLYDKLKKGERFGRLMSEAAYAHIHNLMIDRQIKTAKERFEDFMEKTPYLLDKVPQYHIATYLGITPQHLSRLKKEH